MPVPAVAEKLVCVQLCAGISQSSSWRTLEGPKPPTPKAAVPPGCDICDVNYSFYWDQLQNLLFYHDNQQKGVLILTTSQLFLQLLCSNMAKIQCHAEGG